MAPALNVTKLVVVAAVNFHTRRPSPQSPLGALPFLGQGTIYGPETIIFNRKRRVSEINHSMAEGSMSSRAVSRLPEVYPICTGHTGSKCTVTGVNPKVEQVDLESRPPYVGVIKSILNAFQGIVRPEGEPNTAVRRLN